ncbi:hypothetical protein VTL71DRAFT_9093 [Oculimacula yallundae]|uniref:Uncharacterized protein n=1 Tax=Oculimacula yallundae TaxID=86028 RepID=A0ABR4BUZ9_9HELO
MQFSFATVFVLVAAVAAVAPSAPVADVAGVAAVAPFAEVAEVADAPHGLQKRTCWNLKGKKLEYCQTACKTACNLVTGAMAQSLCVLACNKKPMKE